MKTLARASVVLVLLVSAGICFLGVRAGLSTSVYDLLGGGKRTALTALADKTASQVRILCDDAAAAEACRAVVPFDPPLEPEKFYELVRTHGKGLLAPKQRELLERGETNRIARSALRRDYAGIGLFPSADDPYYFLNDFVMDLKALRPQLKEGQMLLTRSLSPIADGAAIARLIELARTNRRIHLSGAPFHTYLATESSRREINLLGAISLLAVFSLGFLLFRNFKFILPMVLCLSAGFLVGAAAVFTLTMLGGSPHVLTFLFGTTLIGLGVDYCYHGLSRRDDAAERSAFIKNLAVALLTTSLAFVPLLFSSLFILNQMAIFTMAGLVTIFSIVALWFGKSR